MVDLKRAFHGRFRLAVLRLLAEMQPRKSEKYFNRYIALNNRLVLRRASGYGKEQVLVLVPRCLQNAACDRKVTEDIENCARCGRCDIGTIVENVRLRNVAAYVASGGTAAREVIVRRKPAVVLCVGCERELAAGIADFRGTMVIGIINERPCGPCRNTEVDMDEFLRILAGLLCGGD